jgi:uncharacterized membrane protein YkoI
VGGGSGLLYQQAHAVTSVVSLDVNPSVQISVNGQERVLSCTALNDEGVSVLADMNGGTDLKGTKLDVAVNAIMGALLRQGYFDSLSSAILISVEDKDQTRAARLEEELTATVNSIVGQSKAVSILSQTVDAEPSLTQLAQQNHISAGKAVLVNQILSNIGSTDAQEQLSSLSVEELKQLVETGETRVPIGKAAARIAAEQYAGTLQSDAVTAEVDAELDERFPHYEVELYHPTLGKFEYLVDAWTGKILLGQANILTATTGTDTSSAASTATSAAAAATATAAAQEITEAKAKEIALTHAGVAEANATYLTVRRDREHNLVVYKVEFYAGDYEYDYEINAVTGAILEADKELENKAAAAASSATGSATQQITQDKAKEIALTHAGVAAKDAISLYVKQEREYGKTVYEVDFYAGGYEYDYEIDAVTGAILEAEKEVDDKASTRSQIAASAAAAAPDATASATPKAATAPSTTTTTTPSTTTTTTPSAASTAQQITQAKAKEIALNHAGLSESQVRKLKCEQDHENGRLVYEVEFETATMEYEYEIDANSGAILDYEWEYDD